MINYPLKFHPILKEKIWGGNKLKNLLNKKCSLNNVGESWEISGIENNISIVSNGCYSGQSLVDLIKQYKGSFLGDKIYTSFGDRFPLLIKFIDAKYDLSIQLHPTDKLAKKRHSSFGKSELWHVVQADTDSKLIIGFNSLITENKYIEALTKNNITSILNYVNVKPKDSFFINSGTIHAIGSGVLLAEIQQASDITYRVFDWNRKGLNGEERELHTDLALEAIDYYSEDYQKISFDILNTPSPIVENKYFVTNYILINRNLVRQISKDSFKIYMCIQGNGIVKINDFIESVSIGDTILIPAKNKEVIFEAMHMELLEIYIDDDKFLLQN